MNQTAMLIKFLDQEQAKLAADMKRTAVGLTEWQETFRKREHQEEEKNPDA